MSNGSKTKNSDPSSVRKPLSTAMVLIFSALLAAGALYIAGAWDSAMRDQSKEAMELAEAAEAGILEVDPSLIAGIDRGELPAGYDVLKDKLAYLVRLDNEIRFAYILYMDQGNIYIAADSEPQSSPGYSPPGQPYYEANPVYYSAFSGDSTIVTPPVRDRWGHWVSVLVPVKSPDTGKTIALFGVDFPAENWPERAMSRAVEAGLTVASVLLVVLVLHIIAYRNAQLRRERNKLLESEERLQASEKMFRTIFDQVRMGVALVHNDRFMSPVFGDFPTVNPRFLEILGQKIDDLVGLKWETITHPDDLAADLEQFALFKSGQIPGYSMEKRFLKPDGTWAWVNMTISPLYLSTGTDAVHLCVIEDIRHRKVMEQTLKDSERSKAILLDNLPGMAYRCRYDRDWTMEFVSQGCKELTGYDPESLLYNRDLSFNDMITPEYQQSLWEGWERVLAVHEKFQEEYQLITADGTRKWVWEQGQGVYDESGKLVALEGMILDIDDRKKQELQLRYVNNHDGLTGLYNRHYFQELFDRDAVRGGRLAVILINIRKFSLVNTAYGYAYGDRLVLELAEKLQALITPDQILCHISIDRFVLYVKSGADRGQLEALCSQIVMILEESLAHRILGASVGAVEVIEAGCDADTVIKNAAIAASEVAADENFGYRFYDGSMAEAVVRESVLRNELAAEAYGGTLQRLELVYQPIAAVSDSSVIGFEALARFHSHQYGAVQPTEFIPIAEETQLIVPLGRMLLREACLAIRRFSEECHKPLSISVNVSAVQLLRDDFIPELLEILRETGADPGCLGLELTETGFASTFDEMNRRFREIRNAGIKLYIDDFGIGYSSLAREGELNVDYLKIDKFFIDKLMEWDPTKFITQDIISMAHKMGHIVVAEGVEHPRQQELLKEFGCDLFQGYLFSKPVPPAEAVAFLNKCQ